MVIAEFKFSDLPDEWDTVWPLIVANKLPKEAWDFLDSSASDLACSWIQNYDSHSFTVRITAKFADQHDEMIYKLKYPC